MSNLFCVSDWTPVGALFWLCETKN